MLNVLDMKSKVASHIFILACLVFLTSVCGCKKADSAGQKQANDLETKIKSKWGKSLAELPSAQVVVISAHAESIRKEFEQAFAQYYAIEYGKRMTIEWRDVGGGASAMLKYLINVYANAQTSGIDLYFGGGEYPAQVLAAQKLLEPLKLAPEVLANIPAQFSGMPMYDPNHLWCGTVISGFGFIYNVELLNMLKLAPPQTWDDLGKQEFVDLIILPDPTQSGSAAATYEMIVQSAPDWQQGWAKLLTILSNTKKFVDSSSSAADAPSTGEAAIATCIDFFGIERVAKTPKMLVYINPKGQTGYTPDPVAILKNPPHHEEAQQFVDFILSPRGQALWILQPGMVDGPLAHFLGRYPIRKDVYTSYKEKLPAWLSNPYAEGSSMQMDAHMRTVRYGVLSQIVRASAIENGTYLRHARQRLIETKFEPARLAEFNKLPPDVNTSEKVLEIATQLKDPVKAEKILTNWTAFFRAQFENAAK